MATIYIFSGLPFSGKSTFAKKAEEVTTLKRVSFDDLWASFVSIDKNIKYEVMMVEIKKLISTQLEKGFSVIYDSTNLKEAHRKELVDVAKENNAEVIVVYFSISEGEMRKRQSQSLQDNTHHQVSEDNIQIELDLNQVPENAIILETEEDKDVLYQDMIKKFPLE